MGTSWRTWCGPARQLRPVAADTGEAQAVKVVARARKTLIWERNRQVTRLQYQLREFSRPRWTPMAA